MILAIMVMFLLMFLGGVFIALLRSNLFHTSRHSDALNAQQLAQAGIDYSNDQLTNSALGADWRPVPDSPPVIAAKADCREATTQGNVDAHDPDYNWIRQWAPTESGTPTTIEDTRAIPQVINGVRTYPTLTLFPQGPTGGYTRYDYGGGRFLVRVTYNPNNDPSLGPISPDASAPGKPSPLSRFIRIESIGREGIVDPSDPTTYVPQGLRRQMVAFKPISLVDYILFIADRQKTGAPFSLGVSPFPLIDAGTAVTTDNDAVNAGVPGYRFASDGAIGNTKYGPKHVHNLETFYGPIRSNGGLEIIGRPGISLNTDPTDPTLNQQAATRGDKIEVVGSVTRQFTGTPAAANTPAPNLVILAPGVKTNLWSADTESDSPNISGTNGLFVKGVNRIEAPDLEAADPTSQVPRYRLLTRYSAPILPGLTPDQSAVAARNGLGAGIFIDNSQQIQSDTGRFTLQDDWMQPGNNVTSNWTGHIYNPPGVRIQLIPGAVHLPQGTLLDGQTIKEADGFDFPNGLIRITRSDRTWRTPDESNANDQDGIDSGLYTEYFQYPVAPGEKAFTDKYLPSFGNGVIYAQGNVRIWGKLPKDRSNPCATGPDDQTIGQYLNVVSDGTIYVDGSLLKGDAYRPTPNAPQTGPQRSGIALLAKDYVTVNPTAYFAIPPETNSGDWSAFSGEWYNALYLPPQDRYTFSIFNTDDAENYPTDSVSQYAPANGTPASVGVQQEMYTQAAAESTPGAGVQLQINGDSNGQPVFHPWWAALQSNNYYGHVLPARQWAHETTPLFPAVGGSYAWAMNSTNVNWLQFTWKSLSPAWISKVAVAPLDVRIEAVMYAMNGSFFIIPGVPFNNDPLDSRGVAIEDSGGGGLGSGLKRHGGLSSLSPKSSYPFAKEPLDIKITIKGAITENKPAAQNAREAWCRLWGWTPLKKASGAETAHGGDGLSFQFDPQLRDGVRFDAFGRPLPLMPRLPLGSDLVFSGEAQ
jgi:hypothetical protein